MAERDGVGEVVSVRLRGVWRFGPPHGGKTGRIIHKDGDEEGGG